MSPASSVLIGAVVLGIAAIFVLSIQHDTTTSVLFALLLFGGSA
jgi:hypothetical protein